MCKDAIGASKILAHGDEYIIVSIQQDNELDNAAREGRALESRAIFI